MTRKERIFLDFCLCVWRVFESSESIHFERDRIFLGVSFFFIEACLLFIEACDREASKEMAVVSSSQKHSHVRVFLF